MSQLLVYICLVEYTSMVEEMLFCKPLQKTTKANNVFEVVSAYFNHNLFEWENPADRDGQFRIIYYSRIVEPNPDPNPFFAICTINVKAFITSIQQKHNLRTSLLQCNTFKLSTRLPVRAS